MEEKYILTLDIGTTTIRSFIYNSRAETVGRAVDQVVLHYPYPGFVEINPDELWSSVVEVVQKSLKNAHLSAGQITAMGISTQRGTFTTWSQETGKHFHNFITWKDLRADALVKMWNDSYTWKLIKAGSYILYLVLRSKRFRAGSVFKFMNTQVVYTCPVINVTVAAVVMRQLPTVAVSPTELMGLAQEDKDNGDKDEFIGYLTSLRLHWALRNIVELKTAVRNKDAMFGTLDTWLLYKLTDKKIHMTDVSSASATGFYDPFTMQWAGWGTMLLDIPSDFLPTVVDTAGEHFTSTHPDIWGHAIPIRSCMADQTASMWGSCCFDQGDVKLTMGTGTFFNINTGSSPHASVSGLYPVVGWRLGNELIYSAEGANNDTASIIKWAQNLGLFENPEETADIASSVPDSDGVFFVPAFSGLGPPYNDGTAAAGFVGVKPSTTRAHLVRAVLESLAFRTAQLYRCACNETNFNFHTIRLDGGVSNNWFVSQLVSDLTGLRAERPAHVEMSSLGAAHIVGLLLGIWKSKEELKSLRRIGCVFYPRAQVKKSYEETISRWEDAVKRMCGWYKQNKSTQSLHTVIDSNNTTQQNSFQINGRKNGKENGSLST